MTISEKGEELSCFDIKTKTWEITCIHVTKNQNILLGCRHQHWQRQEHGIVIRTDQNGKHLAKYEKDKGKTPFEFFKNKSFFAPRDIVTTSNGLESLGLQRKTYCDQPRQW